MLHLNRLSVFVTVAKTGSFSAAADALSYTQSAVSQQIAALEAETGVTLIERLPRGVRLTTAGEALLTHAESILGRLAAAEAEMEAIAGVRGGQLRMASFPTAGATLMPVAIAMFRAQHPEVELTLAEGEPEEIAPRLFAGEFDLALLFEFEGTSESLVTDLIRQPLFEDPMFLAVPADHPLANRRTLRLADLRAEAWIQTSSSSPCARHHVHCRAARAGVHAAGVGVALIPKLAVASARDDIAIRALSPYSPVRHVIAATPEGSRLTPAAKAMAQIMATVAESFAGPDGVTLA